MSHRLNGKIVSAKVIGFTIFCRKGDSACILGSLYLRRRPVLVYFSYLPHSPFSFLWCMSSNLFQMLFCVVHDISLISDILINGLEAVCSPWACSKEDKFYPIDKETLSNIGRECPLSWSRIFHQHRSVLLVRNLGPLNYWYSLFSY